MVAAARQARVSLRPRLPRVFDEVVDIVNFDLVVVLDHFDLTEVCRHPSPALWRTWQNFELCMHYAPSVTVCLPYSQP